MHVCVVGGLNRPIPVKPSPASTSQDAAAEGLSTTGSGFVAGAAAVQANLYNRFASAMNERGYALFPKFLLLCIEGSCYCRQLLGDLNERFNSLEEGSRNMVAQVSGLAK